jgi:pyruvate/2-oxoglutarate dehydrogenase complex dihydrolipoamide acyltransferase (E2) component
MTNLFTLTDARNRHACEDGYARFEAALRKAYPDVTDLDTILWSIGDVANTDLNDALWCLRLVDDRRTRVAAVMPAVKRASAHTTDERVHWAIGQIDLWLAGDDSVDLGAASAAAWAASAAASAARAAARAAAWAAADVVEAALAAAWAAADVAEARSTERAHQKADLIKAFPPTFPAREQRQ